MKSDNEFEKVDLRFPLIRRGLKKKLHTCLKSRIPEEAICKYTTEKMMFPPRPS